MVVILDGNVLKHRNSTLLGICYLQKKIAKKQVTLGFF